MVDRGASRGWSPPTPGTRVGPGVQVGERRAPGKERVGPSMD